MENNRNYVISGASVETNNRVKGDKVLLNTIESERVERIEADKDIINSLGTIETNELVIYKQLRKQQNVLNAVIGLETFLLIALALVTLQML